MLRHSCASLLLAQEVTLDLVAEQLGHASIRVTKDVYGHLMPRSRARAAEAMRRILYDDSSSAMPLPSGALASPVTTLHPATDLERSTPEYVTRKFVGRPGLDPGTLGSILVRSGASLDVHLSWLEGSASPPSSAEVLSNLGLRLQDWLHETGFGVVGVMRFSNSIGERFELRIENPQFDG